MARPAALTMKSMGSTTGLGPGAGVVVLCRFPVTLSAQSRGFGRRAGRPRAPATRRRPHPPSLPAAVYRADRPARVNGAGEGDGSGRHRTRPKTCTARQSRARMARPAALTMKSMGNTTGLGPGAGVDVLCRFPVTLSPQSRGFGRRSRSDHGLRRPATSPHPPSFPAAVYRADRQPRLRARSARGPRVDNLLAERAESPQPPPGQPTTDARPPSPASMPTQARRALAPPAARARAWRHGRMARPRGGRRASATATAIANPRPRAARRRARRRELGDRRRQPGTAVDHLDPDANAVPPPRPRSPRRRARSRSRSGCLRPGPAAAGPRGRWRGPAGPRRSRCVPRRAPAAGRHASTAVGAAVRSRSDLPKRSSAVDSRRWATRGHRARARRARARARAPAASGGKPAGRDAEREAEPGRGDRAAQLVSGARHRLRPIACDAMSATAATASERTASPHAPRARLKLMATPVDQPVADTPDVDHETVPRDGRASCAAARRASRACALCRVDLNPQTPRRSSSRVKTRVGSPASARSSANSFLDSCTRRRAADTWRESGSSSSGPIRIAPGAGRGARGAAAAQRPAPGARDS